MHHMTSSGHNRPPAFIPVGDLLSRLAVSDRPDIAKIATLVTIPPDTRVFFPGSTVDRIFVHLSGTGMLCEYDHSFEMSFSKPVNPGAIYGVIELLADKGFSDELRTVSECEFYMIERTAFIDLLKAEPDICFELATILAKHLDETVRSVKENG